MQTGQRYAFRGQALGRLLRRGWRRSIPLTRPRDGASVVGDNGSSAAGTHAMVAHMALVRSATKAVTQLGQVLLLQRSQGTRKVGQAF